mmetsp:Transcript_30738/g.60422  ORF Transcript_30738/g.60422 Transcript_30738/m.60422 type:complete len:571 (+) Transcript_30738:51-1763(+)
MHAPICVDGRSRYPSDAHESRNLKVSSTGVKRRASGMLSVSSPAGMAVASPAPLLPPLGHSVDLRDAAIRATKAAAWLVSFAREAKSSAEALAAATRRSATSLGDVGARNADDCERVAHILGVACTVGSELSIRAHEALLRAAHLDVCMRQAERLVQCPSLPPLALTGADGDANEIGGLIPTSPVLGAPPPAGTDSNGLISKRRHGKFMASASRRLVAKSSSLENGTSPNHTGAALRTAGLVRARKPTKPEMLVAKNGGGASGSRSGSSRTGLQQQQQQHRQQQKQQPGSTKGTLKVVPRQFFKDAARKASCRLAEQRAEQILAQGTRIRDKDVENVLETWVFRRNKKRVNVMPDGKSFVNSEMLGLTRIRAYQKFVVASQTRKFPLVTKLLCQFLDDNPPKGLERGTRFPFSTICINKDYAAKRHRDNNNMGVSVVRGLGTYTGGHLRYWPQDPGPKTMPDVLGLELNDAVLLDTKRRSICLDSTKAHEVLPFEGKRYSLVYFTIPGYERSDKPVREFLAERCGLNCVDRKASEPVWERATASAGISGERRKSAVARVPVRMADSQLLD